MKWSRIVLLIIISLSLIIFSTSCDLLDRFRGTYATPPSETPQTEVDLFDDSSRALVHSASADVVAGEVLIKFAPDVISELPTEKKESSFGALSVQSAQIDPLLEELEITSLEPLLAPVAAGGNQSIQSLSAKSGEAGQMYVAQFDAGRDPNEVAVAINANPKVEYAEPNYVAYATAGPVFAPSQFVPNDSFYAYQWNLTAIQMERAWDVNRGGGLIVAVLDTGVAYENFGDFTQAPDLAGTKFVPGYNFINNTPHANDDQGHGTHVAGTIAQTTNNEQGVSGVAYEAAIMPVKVLDRRGQGSYAGIVQGITFAIENGAKVINMSLTGGASSRALEEAINQAYSKGVIVVAAAGNNNGPVGYPAAYFSTIAVGATRLDNARAPYSNYGSHLDVVAPGGDNNVDQNNDEMGDGIVQQSFKDGAVNDFRYLFFEGTSMATPHVSGVAALLLSKKPEASPQQIKEALRNSAKDLGPPGFDNQYGAGLIQAFDALAELDSQPAPPTPIPPTNTPTKVHDNDTTSQPATPTPNPIVNVENNLIRNGDFEAMSDWNFQPGAKLGLYSSEQANSGSWSAKLGITNAENDYYSYSSVVQAVTIPANARRATLNAYVYLYSQDTSGRDLQLIIILDENNRILEQRMRERSNAATWQQKTYDITRYGGQTIRVYFGVRNDGRGGSTAMYVDDVSLVVEQ